MRSLNWKMFIAMGLIICLAAACGAPATTNKENNQKAEGKAEGEKTVVTWLQWWKTEAGEEPLNELVAAFEAKHPNIKIDVQDLPFAQVHDKIVTLNSSGNTPDVIAISSPWVTEFAITGLRSLWTSITTKCRRTSRKTRKDRSGRIGRASITRSDSLRVIWLSSTTRKTRRKEYPTS